MQGPCDGMAHLLTGSGLRQVIRPQESLEEACPGLVSVICSIIHPYKNCAICSKCLTLLCLSSDSDSFKMKLALHCAQRFLRMIHMKLIYLQHNHTSG